MVMKRVLVALLVTVVALSSSATTAKKKTVKPAADQEVLVAQKTEENRKPVPQSKSRKRLSSDDDPDATRNSGPVAVGPAVATRMSKASSNKLDLRSLPFVTPEKIERPEREEPPLNPTSAGALTIGTPPSSSLPQPPQRSAPAPAPLTTFDGLDFATWGAGHPPDTNGDVGPNYYIQTINTSIGVFRKSDGVRVAAFTFNTFMSQGHFGNLCDTNNFGDPVVLYDSFEDRWIITDFAFQLSSGNVVNPPGSFQCFAVSMNGDPVTGGWNFYSINTTGGLGDYPKLGIWPDGLYMSVNMFGYPSGAPFQDTRLYALNKAQMYAGSPTVKVVSFDLPSDQFTVIPANARLQTGTPPTGSPNYFASVWNFLDSVQIWKFHVDWDHLPLSTVTGASDATAASWWEQYSRSGTSTAPTTANFNDTLYPRLMVQNQYSNLAGAESLWLSHTVGAGNPGPANVTSAQSAVRYYQVNVTGGTVAASLPQAFTYSPDATVFRYMPSVAVNRAGDLAMGYTTSNATTNPTLSYAGRLAADAPNTITFSEQLLFAGTGSQSGTCGTTCTRWGDYSAMTLDPDGCKFWYTNEYYATTGLNHQTRIGAFVYPSCTPVGAGGSVQGTVTAAAGGAPISGATVSLGARTTTTNASGGYTFSGIPAGTYPSITASAPGFIPSTANAIVVTDGGTTIQDLSLTSASSGTCLFDTTQADFQSGVATNVEVTSSPGDVKLTNPNIVDQQSTSAIAGGFSLTSTSWNGQTFKAGISGTLVAVDVNLFCLSCTGTTPNFTASIRATSAGLPTGADLVSTTIPGFNDGGAGSTHTADFSATPLTLTAGTTYAFIIHPVANPSAGGYDFSVSFTPNPYPFGSRMSSTNSGGTWAATATRSAIFHTYVNNGFSPSGNLISSAKDGNPSIGNAPTWTTLSWTAATPASTSIQFQAAGSNSANGPFNFVGPDGTAGTFFTTSGASIAQFNGFRYLEYKAILTSSNTTVTPALNDVTVCFADVACGSPAPPITPTPTPVCGGSAGNTAAGPAAMANYSWAITNGTITAGINSQTVTYTAGATGTADLMLTVTDATGCVKSNSISVPITPNPIPPITPTPATVCSNSAGNTASGPAGPTSYAWSITNGTITSATNAQSITYTAGASGSVGLTLVVTNVGGCVATNTVNVPISGFPATPAITPTPSTVCANSTGNSAAGPAGATTYAWSIVNGSITSATDSQTITYTAGASGTADLTLIVTNAAGCATPNTVNVPISANPATPAITPTPATVCGGSAGNSAAGPAGATTYAWSIVNGAITSATDIQTITYTAGAAGTVDLTLIVTNGAGCSASNTVNVLINPAPATPAITPTPASVCGNSTANSAAGPAGATTYAWSIVNGAITSATNIQTITYTAGASGTVDLTLVVTNASACSNTNTINVPINPQPGAPTISGTLVFCSGGNTTLFSDYADGNQWYVGGTLITGATNQAFVATAPGSYTVTVTDGNGCTSVQSAPAVVTVNNPPPTPTIAGTTNGTGTQDQACPEQPLTLTATSAGATSFQWYSNNDTLNGETNSTYQATGTATYFVTATVNGCVSAQSAGYVVQNPTPHTAFLDAAGPTTFCTGGSVQLQSNSATGIQWYRDTGSGPVAIAGAGSQNYVATVSGTYTVILNALGCHTGTSNAIVVTVNTIPPTPTATPGGPTTFCAGGSVLLTSDSTSGNQWLLDGNPIGGATNQTYSATLTGSYTVRVTATGCTSAASNAVSVTVNPIPATPTITPGGPTTFCTGGSVTLTSSSASGNQWNLNGNPIGGATNNTYSAAASGSYTVVVTTNGCSSAASAATSVTVNPIPATPTITPGGPTTFCAGGSVTLTSSSASGNQWLLNGNPIGGATSSTYSATATGSYTVTVTTTGCTSAASNAVAVTVNPIPATPTITPGGPTTFCAGGSVTLTSSSASGNQWFLNGNPIGGATNQTFIASASGGYTVKITTSGCTSAASAATTVTVNPNPNATITAASSTPSGSTGNIASVANAGAGATYAWSVTGGTLTAGNNTPSITYTAGAVGTLTINVTVTTSANCSDAKSANVTVTAPLVTVTSVSPTGGTIAGGSAVTINGTGFIPGAGVTFGGAAATNVVVVSAIKIAARTPAHALGPVNVTVTNTNTTTATLTNGYLYKAQQFDPNNDGTITSADIFYLVNYLFMSGPPPSGAAGVLSGDANGDGMVDSADIFFLVNYLFLSGPRPNAVPNVPRVEGTVAGAEPAPIAGSIALGKAVLRDGHYVIPVIMTAKNGKNGSMTPQAMSLRIHLQSDAATGEVAIHKAGAAKDLALPFEIDRRTGNDLSYIVSYGALSLGETHSAIVAEVEVDASAGRVAISVDPKLTMLSNQAGTSTATVANGKLEVTGTTIGSGASPRPHTGEIN
jgi:hypothetical protein